MKNEGLGSFYSLLLAIAVYVGFVLFIFFKPLENAVKYTDIKDSFIDVVELGTYVKPKPSLDENKKDGEETTNKTLKVEKKPQKGTKISDLFGDTSEFLQEKSTKVQSSAKSKKDAQKKRRDEIAKKAAESLLPTKEEGEDIKKQQTGLYEKFLGTVHRKMYENWTLYEIKGNFSAKLEFVIESNGYFRYNSVTKSGNAEFDAKVVDFLSTLQGKYIAVPPRNKPYKGNANLADEITITEKK